MTARSLSLREKRLIQVAILLVILVLISLLMRGGNSRPPPEPVAAGVPAPTGATYAGPPPPVTPRPVATVMPAPPAMPAADASQLKLYGLLASGAVIGYPNGGQRLVPVGREALPGLVLVRVEQNHAVFQSAGGEVRLGFDGNSPGRAAEPAPDPAR